MPQTRPPLDKEEFLALSNQKADDWREITRISATFLGIAAALFAAGVAKQSAWVVILSPLPLFLGVLQMTRNARLQLQMITYLSVFSPFEDTSWESDISFIRLRFWDEAERGWLASQIERRYGDRGKSLARHMTNPSAWDLWLVIAILVGVGADVVPLFTCFDEAGWAFLVGVVLLALGAFLVGLDIARVEPERERWKEIWERYKRGEIEKPVKHRGDPH